MVVTSIRGSVQAEELVAGLALMTGLFAVQCYCHLYTWKPSQLLNHKVKK